MKTELLLLILGVVLAPVFVYAMWSRCKWNACRWVEVADLEATTDRDKSSIWQCTRCKTISLGRYNPHRWDSQR